MIWLGSILTIARSLAILGPLLVCHPLMLMLLVS